ncbi:MAG: hypothetical protein QM758_16885 [Armatimonas sp.]
MKPAASSPLHVPTASRPCWAAWGESSLAIAAGAHISPLFDHLDLDSHQNLTNDPFVGISWHEGKVIPGDSPGLGISLA